MIARSDDAQHGTGTGQIPHTDSMAKNHATGIAEEVTAYLSAAPAEGRERYALVRSAVHAQAGAVRVSERMSYKMPTFFVNGKVLLHVGLWDEHLAIYPVPDSTTDATLAEDLEPQRKGKGTLHFPYADDWPTQLVERVIAAHLARLG